MMSLPHQPEEKPSVAWRCKSRLESNQVVESTNCLRNGSMRASGGIIATGAVSLRAALSG
jgi:hypothetical protein